MKNKYIVLIFLLIAFSGFTTLPVQRQTSPPAHYIGEKFGGGIVFYVSDSGRHGLIVTNADLSTNATWYNGTYKTTGTAEGKDDGAANTLAIIAAQKNDNAAGTYAAKICSDYSNTADGKTYDDWYLPSIAELTLLYNKQHQVGSFDDRYYWTSNEKDADLGWCVAFYDGQLWDINKQETNYVRAIRKF